MASKLADSRGNLGVAQRQRRRDEGVAARHCSGAVAVSPQRPLVGIIYGCNCSTLLVVPPLPPLCCFCTFIHLTVTHAD